MPKPPIKFGTTAPLTGIEAEVGKQVVQGLKVALGLCEQDPENRIQLIVHDDKSIPAVAARATRQLIDQEGIVTLVNNVGTSALILSRKLAEEKNILLFAPVSGMPHEDELNSNRNLIFYRPRLIDEIYSLFSWLIKVDGVKPDEVAVFTPRDSYGDLSFAIAIAALRTHGLLDESAVVHARVDASSLAVENGLADLLEAPRKPQAVLFIGSHLQASKLVKLAKIHAPSIRFLFVSLIGGDLLLKNLGEDAEGIVMTQVVPDYQGDQPLSVSYREAFAKCGANSQIGFLSFESYISGLLLNQAMKVVLDEHSATPVTSESIVRGFESLGEQELCSNFTVSISPYYHRLSDQVWASTVKDGRFVYFDWTRPIASLDNANSSERKVSEVSPEDQSPATVDAQQVPPDSLFQDSQGSND